MVARRPACHWTSALSPPPHTCGWPLSTGAGATAPLTALRAVAAAASIRRAASQPPRGRPQSGPVDGRRPHSHSAATNGALVLCGCMGGRWAATPPPCSGADWGCGGRHPRSPTRGRRSWTWTGWRRRRGHVGVRGRAAEKAVRAVHEALFGMEDTAEESGETSPCRIIVWFDGMASPRAHAFPPTGAAMPSHACTFPSRCLYSLLLTHSRNVRSGCGRGSNVKKRAAQAGPARNGTRRRVVYS